MAFHTVVFLFCCIPWSLLLFASSQQKKETFPPMDVVYTWVDSSDPLWQTQRAYYVKREKGLSRDANLAYRFRSRNELLYSLRSVARYAPYVRKIFIVTNGQKPSWIKPHPKICFVSHSQIFRDVAHLPTFNSMAIESCLHRIPGLSEYYVYFNDDVFLGRPTTWSSFFTKNGKIRFFLTERGISREKPEGHTIGYKIAIYNTDLLLSKEFSKEKRFHLGHTPDPAKKSLFSSIERRFFRIFTSVESHRFRHTDDYALTNGLLPYAALYMHQGVVTDVFFRKFVIRGEWKEDKQTLSTLLKSKPLFFCIEDCQSKENKKIDALLAKTLKRRFSKPAPWEISFDGEEYTYDDESQTSDE